MPEFDVLLLYLFLQFYKFIAKIKISFFRCKEQPFIEYFKINANFSQKKKYVTDFQMIEKVLKTKMI